MLEIVEIKKGEDSYPPLLMETTNPPGQIFVRGKLPEYHKPHIAIVGTRKATEDGTTMARKLAKNLAERGVVIVSGLAMGIDTAAHRGALDAKGETIAVLGNGADKIYPAQNENLAREIFNGHGAIISEYAPGTPGLPHQFLERNRIVAGLCVATIVIQAPEKSGAIVTARLAAEYGREVFVFPGTAGDPQYTGSHKLIRDGARLVHSLDDILEDLSLDVERTEQKELFHTPMPQLSGDEQNIFNIISEDEETASIDKIIEKSKLPPQAVNKIVTELLIKGIIEEDGFGYKIKN